MLSHLQEASHAPEHLVISVSSDLGGHLFLAYYQVEGRQDVIDGYLCKFVWRLTVEREKLYDQLRNPSLSVILLQSLIERLKCLLKVDSRWHFRIFVLECRQILTDRVHILS